MWASTKDWAVPEITAVAPVSVQPAGSRMKARLAPSLSTISLFGVPGIARVTVPPGVLNVVESDWKMPLVSGSPGRSNTQVSSSGKGPPPG